LYSNFDKPIVVERLAREGSLLYTEVLALVSTMAGEFQQHLSEGEVEVVESSW
jgi:hypothetical protein